MADMANPPGLVRRNGTYYYRARVPKDLVAVIRKTEVKESLKTADFKEAKRRRNHVAVEWDARFDQARQRPAQSTSATPEPLTREQAMRLVRDYVERMDREWRQQEVERPPATTEELREQLIDLGITEQMLRDPEQLNRDHVIWPMVQELLEGSGFRLGEDGIPRPELWELVRRGLLELYRRAEARLNDDFSAACFDQLFAPGHGSKATAQSPSFGTLCDQYLKIYLQDAAAKNIHQQRIDKVKAHLALVREIIGEDTPVAGIDYDRCLEFRETLAMVPARRTQFYGDMPLKDAIAAAAKAGRPTMSYETQSGYLGILTQVLKLAHRKNLISDVPSVDLRPIAKKKPDKEKREPFSPEQLKAFFHSAYYLACAQSGDRPYLKADSSARFWLPVISLLTGMRPKEICQMHVADLRVSHDGVPFFHVIADEDEKTEKTPTSRRKIPVHPELVRMGWLEHVESVRSQGHTRLFPELKKNKYGNYSAYILRRFRETFLPDAIAVDTNQTFYSFRHSFRDALRRIEAPPEILQAIGGWGQGKLVSDAYGEGFEVGHLRKYVGKVAYPGLEWSHLYVKEPSAQVASA